MEGTPALRGCNDLSCQQQQQGTEKYINTTVDAPQQIRSIETYVKVFRMYLYGFNLG